MKNLLILILLIVAGVALFFVVSLVIQAAFSITVFLIKVFFISLLLIPLYVYLRKRLN